MNRRVIVFFDECKNLFVSPQYNGDKTKPKHLEFNFYDLDWMGIAHLFESVTTLPAFNEACRQAQLKYPSCFGDQSLVQRISEVADLNSEDIYLLYDGQLFPIRTDYDELLSRAYEAYILDWCSQRNYNVENWDDETGFRGESFVCKDEFEDEEFSDAAYMQVLLPPILYAAYLIEAAKQANKLS